MRLNLFNQTVIVSSAVHQAGLTNLNPRFGTVHPINDKSFKYAVSGDALNAVLVERVDLGELFATIPQDITGFEFKDSLTTPDALNEKLSIDLLTQEYPVIAQEADQLSPGDSLGLLFSQWKRVVGLNGLSLSEVDLSSFEDYMTIDARNAVLFKGTVQVKIK
jgi:hypothetical protein